LRQLCGSPSALTHSYFNAYDEETGTAGGVPLETLQNNKYREILQYLLWHDSSTDALMQECAHSMQQSLRKQAGGQISKSKSVYNQRSLGTIKKRKQDKKQEEAPSNEILIMKLLRWVASSGLVRCPSH
jgi:hypothetical protein